MATVLRAKYLSQYLWAGYWILETLANEESSMLFEVTNIILALLLSLYIFISYFLEKKYIWHLWKVNKSETLFCKVILLLLLVLPVKECSHVQLIFPFHNGGRGIYINPFCRLWVRLCIPLYGLMNIYSYEQCHDNLLSNCLPMWVGVSWQDIIWSGLLYLRRTNSRYLISLFCLLSKYRSKAFTLSEFTLSLSPSSQFCILALILQTFT